MVSAGAGLMTDYTFTTTEATMICASMEASACVAARTALNAKLPGAAASILDTGAGGIAEAELKAKLEALQEANKKFQEESGDADGSGGAVNSETLAALRETQTELRETKMRLETARSALELKEKEMTSKSGDSNTRIIELEQQLSVQTKAAQEGSASSDSKSAAATKALNEKLVKITAEMAGWKQKAEATEVTANRLKAAAAEGGEGGGGAVIAEMTEENEKLKAQVEKLTVRLSNSSLHNSCIRQSSFSLTLGCICARCLVLSGERQDGYREASGKDEGSKDSRGGNGEDEEATTEGDSHRQGASSLYLSIHQVDQSHRHCVGLV